MVGFIINPLIVCVCCFSQRKYREVWDTEKTNIHLNNDLPSIVLSKANAIAISNVRLVH